MGSEQGASLHAGWNFYAGECQSCGREVDVRDELIASRARWKEFRSPNHERDLQSFFVEKLFAACVTDSVISQEENDSVVEDVFFFQTLQDPANLDVGVLHGVEVFGPVLANDWMVGIVRRKLDFCRRDQVS